MGSFLFRGIKESLNGFFRLFFLLIITVAITACGGGSDDDTSSGTVNLFANAGADISVTEGAEVMLSATAQGGTQPYTFSWSSSPSLDITQDDNTTGSATFTAPAVTESTLYTLTLLVNDTAGASVSDTLVVTVEPTNISPVALITVPQWDGLATNTLPAGVSVTLDGSSSTDQDASDSSSPIASYAWSQTSGTNVITGVDADEATLTFVTPISSTQETLVFQLTVTDEEGATGASSVSLLIQTDTDTLPVVSAGYSQGIFSGETILLAGTASTSVPSALPLTYLWTTDAPLSVSDDNMVGALTIDESTELSTYALAPLVESYTLVTYTLSVTDAFGNTVDDSISVAIRPLPTQLINDTGVLQQATDTAITTVQQNDWPGQDAQRGADVVAQNGFIEKAGRGAQGFDFTRLNTNGDEQDDSATTWSCVRDNVTGLVWEVKTDDGGLHDGDNTYSWYQDEVSGGFTGDINGTGATCTMTNCNTQAYVTEVNTQGLCGFYDWRMPTHNELFSLMHFGVPTRAAIDTDYFPNTGDLATTPLWYWTSVPSADGVSNDAAQNAWALDFDSGVDNFLNKSTPAYVRLVRAGR